MTQSLSVEKMNQEETHTVLLFGLVGVTGTKAKLWEQAFLPQKVKWVYLISQRIVDIKGSTMHAPTMTK
jgi:hypothetical protein